MHVTLLQSRLCKALLLTFGITLIVATFVFLPELVHAQTDELADVGAASGLSTEDLASIIGRIISVFLSVLGVVLLIIIIYAGYLWMTAGGNPDQVAKAKQWMINAVIGLIIVLASYAITVFIVNALGGSIMGGGAGSGYDTTDASIERRSGSLGQGGINYHYPARNATDVARNTKIFITFKSAMDIEAFIDGYDTNGTPQDTSDDIMATTLNTDNILIYPSAQGEGEALDGDEVSVTFTEDLKTFSFTPSDYLGSSTQNVSYTVFISDDVDDVNGNQMVSTGGYEWSFEVGTRIDLEPPTVVSVTPRAGREYDRNIVVQVTFSEAVDPTSATGTRMSDSGFSNIQVYGTDTIAVTGTYSSSNSYRTVTFITDDACGTNSCGETLYCLPGDDSIGVNVFAPTIDPENPPQASGFPYDGIVDSSGNGLDGNGDGVAGDDYAWSFTTSNDINLEAPQIDAIAPDILEEDVELDRSIEILFDSIMLSSSLDSNSIALRSSPSHEMWYVVENQAVNGDGEAVSRSSEESVATKVSISHGVFLETREDALTGESCSEQDDCRSGEACSTDSQCYVPGVAFLYAVDVSDGVKNEYQNCYVPGEGPDGDGGSCGTSDSQPYCCNGEPSSSACNYFSS